MQTMSCKNCPLKASDVHQNYKPTKREQIIIRPRKEHLVLSGDRIFHTIQGEGVRLGRPVTFVRLHFCNLHCSWCDSWYTWKRDTKEFWQEPLTITTESLTQRIIDTQKAAGVSHIIKRVVFTGGEPLIQQGEIVKWMEANPSWEVEIETNGTIIPHKYLLGHAHFNCSPKLESSGNTIARKGDRVLESISKTQDPCFKFVCSTPEDVREVLQEYSFLPRSQVFIMPEGVTKEENFESYKRMRDVILQEGLNTTPRLQNIMFHGALRGV